MSNRINRRQVRAFAVIAIEASQGQIAGHRRAVMAPSNDVIHFKTNQDLIRR